MRLALWILITATLAACQSAPPARVETVELPVRQYVPVPKELTKRCKWPKAPPLREVIDAAAKRKKCLLQYEGQFDGIEKLEAAP